MQNVVQLHAYNCYQNVTEPQATEYHTRVHTRVQHRNCESGLAKACCTQAGPAHAAGHVEMSWTDEAIFLPCATGSPHHCSHNLRDLIPVTATMANGIDRLSCSYLYRSSH